MAEDYTEDLVDKLKAELLTFEEIQGKLEENRDEHTHWPMLDAVSSILLDHVNEALMQALVADPNGVEKALSGIYQEMVERVFFAGYQFRERDIVITECPVKHSAPQQSEKN